MTAFVTCRGCGRRVGVTAGKKEDHRDAICRFCSPPKKTTLKIIQVFEARRLLNGLIRLKWPTGNFDLTDAEATQLARVLLNAMQEKEDDDGSSDHSG